MVEVVDVVCVVGEKCVDARARANKLTKETLLIQEQTRTGTRTRTRQANLKTQDTCVCANTQKLYSVTIRSQETVRNAGRTLQIRVPTQPLSMAPLRSNLR